MDTCPTVTTSKPWFRSARKTKSIEQEIAQQKECKSRQESSCQILRNLTHLQNVTSTQLIQTDVLYRYVKVGQQRVSTIYDTQLRQKVYIYTVK